MALSLQDGKLRTPLQKDNPWSLQDGKLRALSAKQTNIIFNGEITGTSSFVAALNVIEPIVSFEAEITTLSTVTADLKLFARMEAEITASTVMSAILIVIGAGSAPIPPEVHDIILANNDLDIILDNSVP